MKRRGEEKIGVKKGEAMAYGGLRKWRWGVHGVDMCWCMKQRVGKEEGDSAIQKMDGTRKRIRLRLAI